MFGRRWRISLSFASPTQQLTFVVLRCSDPILLHDVEIGQVRIIRQGFSVVAVRDAVQFADCGNNTLATSGTTP